MTTSRVTTTSERAVHPEHPSKLHVRCQSSSTDLSCVAIAKSRDSDWRVELVKTKAQGVASKGRQNSEQADAQWSPVADHQLHNVTLCLHVYTTINLSVCAGALSRLSALHCRMAKLKIEVKATLGYKFKLASPIRRTTTFHCPHISCGNHEPEITEGTRSRSQGGVSVR